MESLRIKIRMLRFWYKYGVKEANFERLYDFIYCPKVLFFSAPSVGFEFVWECFKIVTSQEFF